MNLNKEEILGLAKEIREEKDNDIRAQKREKLVKILDDAGVNDVLDLPNNENVADSIIENGKVHKLDRDDGFDTLNGLLERKITGNVDITNYYMIRPEYVLELPKKERKKFAEAITRNSDRKDLSEALQNLWDNGIATKACSTLSKDGGQLILATATLDDVKSQQKIEQFYNQKGIDPYVQYDTKDRRFNVFFREEDENVNIYTILKQNPEKNKSNYEDKGISHKDAFDNTISEELDKSYRSIKFLNIMLEKNELKKDDEKFSEQKCNRLQSLISEDEKKIKDLEEQREISPYKEKSEENKELSPAKAGFIAGLRDGTVSHEDREKNDVKAIEAEEKAVESKDLSDINDPKKVEAPSDPNDPII